VGQTPDPRASLARRGRRANRRPRPPRGARAGNSVDSRGYERVGQRALALERPAHRATPRAWRLGLAPSLSRGDRRAIRRPGRPETKASGAGGRPAAARDRGSGGRHRRPGAPGEHHRGSASQSRLAREPGPRGSSGIAAATLGVSAGGRQRGLWAATGSPEARPRCRFSAASPPAVALAPRDAERESGPRARAS
jgi:hypothetical protein